MSGRAQLAVQRQPPPARNVSQQNALASRSVAAQSSRQSALATGVLQRRCACGTHTPGGGRCDDCAGKRHGLQKKLAVGATNDAYEQEADRIAEQVLSAPPGLSRATPHIQRYGGHGDETREAPASVDRALAGPGVPLAPSLREEMEHRFSRDFSSVRVYNDAESARELDARAYTVGNGIVFGAGQFAPATRDGHRLLAHELTHVVQQTGPAPRAVQRDAYHDDSGTGGALHPLPNRPNDDADQNPIQLDQPKPNAPDKDKPKAPDKAPDKKDKPQASCPLTISGPDTVNHYCAAYVPSDAKTCGVFPAPNITLTASGAAAGATLAWSITQGGKLASISGAANGTSADITGDAQSAKKGDVTVQVTDGKCTAAKNITVLQPASMTASESAGKGRSFVKLDITYTVKDQFGTVMGAGICVDETITECWATHNFQPNWKDAPTGSAGQVVDNLIISVTPTLPDSFCFKFNQSVTIAGCGPVMNNVILFQPSGASLARSKSCKEDALCP